MTFEEENNVLLEDILNDAFYKGFKNKEDARYPGTSLELNITASCNQKCEYCYLTKFGSEIYPVEIRKENGIIENVKMLIDYFLENDMHPSTLDIFSGEIWGTDFSDRLFDAILNGIKRGWRIPYIMIPSNMSFVIDDTKRGHVERNIEDFRNIGVQLQFSASIDGLLLETTQRSFVNEKDNEMKNHQDYYDKIFTWCKKYRYCFHPMVAAYGIEKWIENYKWFQHMFTKYRMNPFEYGMYLEVRNDDWTLEKIDSYLDFLNFMIDYDFKELLGGELDTFTNEVIKISPAKHKGYFPYVIIDTGDTFNCTINTSLIVRMGDLAIGPCHRTHYNQFIYGHYKVDNGKIVGLDANNVQLANLVLNQSSKTLMNCDRCPIDHYCMRGCLGAQYESTGEILSTCASVCQMVKAKYIFLYLKYKKMGIIDKAKNDGAFAQRNFTKTFEEKINILKEGEPALWNYWKTKTYQKI